MSAKRKRRPSGPAIRSYAEVGRMLGISPQAVHQGESSAIRKIRKGLGDILEELHESSGGRSASAFRSVTVRDKDKEVA